MGTLSSPSITTLFTITSPDSRKVVNVLENPNVEWMFTNPSREEVAYLRGKARIVHDPEEIEGTAPKENLYKIMQPPFA